MDLHVENLTCARPDVAEGRPLAALAASGPDILLLAAP